MTRIDCIQASLLPDKHIRSGYRELLRVRHLHPSNRDLAKLPENYKMGTGHVLFFANKGKWLLRRHEELRQEMIKRGNKADFKLDLSHWPEEAMGDWEPDVDAKLVCVARVINRASNWK